MLYQQKLIIQGSNYYTWPLLLLGQKGKFLFFVFAASKQMFYENQPPRRSQVGIPTSFATNTAHMNEGPGRNARNMPLVIFLFHLWFPCPLRRFRFQVKRNQRKAKRDRISVIQGGGGGGKTDPVSGQIYDLTVQANLPFGSRVWFGFNVPFVASVSRSNETICNKQIRPVSQKAEETKP